jgi:hypothetical protein
MEYDIKGGTIFPHCLPFIFSIQRNNWERLPAVHTLVTENFCYKNISVNIFHKIIILKVLNRMFKGFTVDSDASISFGELPVGGHETKEEVGPMNVPPIDEYQSQFLLDNTIFLAKKSEREVDSNLIVVGGLPCSFSFLAIYDVILKIGNLLNHIYTLHIDIMALELFLRASDRDQITLYSDGRTCSLTLDLPNVKKFAMGGHMFFPAAFGYCSTPHISFDFTCQAMPVPASLLSLKCLSELAAFRGIPHHEAECQCIKSLISDRVETVYALKLNMDITSFDYQLAPAGKIVDSSPFLHTVLVENVNDTPQLESVTALESTEIEPPPPNE